MTATLPPALVLAAGLGTRLRPLTFCRAKAAVPVAGVPVICRHLARLAARGVRDVRVGDLWTFDAERPYDTVLALMNGTATAASFWMPKRADANSGMFGNMSATRSPF